jgi:CBS domain-containing protein
MRVNQIMTRDVETVSADRTLMVAAQRMRQRDIGFLPVTNENKVVGVITDRDITLRALGEGRVPQMTVVGEVMTPRLVWCWDDATLTEAAELMETNCVRRLLVLDHKGKLAGLLSLDDLAAHMSSDRLLGIVVRNVTATDNAT